MHEVVDMEYTATAKPLPPTTPYEEIETLAVSVDSLTFGQSRAARIVLNWLNAVAPTEEAETNEQ